MGHYKLIFIILLFTISGSIKSQEIRFPFRPDSSIIMIKGMYKGLGKVFNNCSEGERIINDYGRCKKISHQEIIQCEKILSQYSTITSIHQKKTNLNLRNIKKYYYRQYIGYIDNKNDTCVLLVLLNFKNKKKAKEYFPDFSKFVSIGVGGFYGFNQTIFKINLSKNIIKYY